MYLQKTIPLKLYDCVVKVIVTSKIKEKVNKIQEDNGKSYRLSQNVEGVAFNFDIDKYYIVLSADHLSINVLVHEVFHSISAITYDRNIRNEESSAWIYGHIAQEIYNFLKQKGISL